LTWYRLVAFRLHERNRKEDRLARSELIEGRRRSAITLPGYRLGVPPMNAGKKYPAEVLTTEQVMGLLAACSRRGNAGIRNRALIVTMWRAGLRIAEALALRPKDINLESGTIQVLHGKGDRRRVVGIDPEGAAVIELWLARRRQLGAHARQPVFCVISHPNIGKPLHSAYVREMLKDLAGKTGLADEGVRVHPHGLRHTYAASLAREGVPVHVIRRALGHASLATTDRYIDHLSPLEVVATMRARTWEPVSHEQPLVAA
jgi:site-specific recombinase XerD